MELSKLQGEVDSRRKLMACLCLGILSTDCPDRPEDAQILEIDAQFTQLTGYTAEDLQVLFGGRYLELVDKRDRARVAELFRSHTHEGATFELQYRLVTRDETLLWIREVGYVTEGAVKVRQSVLSNITRQHETAEQLAQSAQMYQIASDVSGGAVYDYEFSTGTYLRFENAERIYGVSADQIIEETQWFGTLPPDKALGAMADYFYHPEDVPAVLEALEHLQSDRVVHYMARSRRPDGTFLWTQVHIALIFDRYGQPVRRIGYIFDIDAFKRHSDNMAQSEQLFRITNHASGGAVFDFDFQTGTYLHFENAERIYGVPAQRIISDTKWFATLSPPKALEAMIAYFYHADDAAIVRDAFARLPTEHSITYVARSKRHDGSYIWSQVHIALIFDEAGEPVRRVGHILDIDEMARQMEMLRSQAQADPLTGIYNKQATQAIVETVLRKRDGELCALMVLDLDNFKGVNDTFGHAVGDTVLVDVSGKLKATFGDQTLGRIGGDEFIVFVLGVADRSAVLERAELICQLFRQTFIGPDTNYKISCSIGIAIAGGERRFTELFQKADAALYQAKSRGKDCYCIYDDSCTEQLRWRDDMQHPSTP